MALKLTDHIKLIEYFAAQASTFIKAKKYYKAYMELQKVQNLTRKTQQLVKNNFSDTEIPVSLELRDDQSQSVD